MRKSDSELTKQVIHASYLQLYLSKLQMTLSGARCPNLLAAQKQLGISLTGYGILIHALCVTNTNLPWNVEQRRKVSNTNEDVIVNC